MEGHNDTLEKINGEREAKRKYLQEFVKRMQFKAQKIGIKIDKNDELEYDSDPIY